MNNKNNIENKKRNFLFTVILNGCGKFFNQLFILCALITCFSLYANGQAANLDQVRNGSSSSPNNPGAWVNGNVNASQAHMVEGYSVPYRMVVTNLTAGAHRLDIGYQVRVNSKNGLDYLTHFNRLEPHITQFGHAAETINPLIGTGLSSPNVITFPIPVPGPSKLVSGVPQPQTSFNSLPAAQRAMTMYNGLAIDSITYLSEGSLTVASSITTIRIWFRTNNATVVFAWGGHIASQYDWGAGQSASSISGSPYHMSLAGIDGSGGSQDRALAAAAVVAPQCLISGPTTVCSGSTNTYIGPAGAGFTYTWTIINNTSGASIVGSNTGQTVSVNSGSTAGSFGLQINVSSGISNSTCNITITVNGATSCSISPTTPICPGATRTYTAPAGMDTYQWSITGSGTISGSSTGQTVSVAAGNVCNGSYTLSLAVSKGACSSSCSQIISVIDNTAPTIGQPGAGATISCTAAVTFTAPTTASDGCDPNPQIQEVSDITTPGSCANAYTRTKTWRAVDACGNPSNTVSQTITVVDNLAPTIGQPGAGSTINCPASPVFTAPTTASDGCDPNPQIQEVSDVTTPGSCPNTYTRTKTWRAVDACGNPSSTVSQTITVVDNLAPTIGQPGPSATINCPATPVFTPPTSASDGCDSNPQILEISDVTTPGSCGNSYTRTKTWRAKDACQNMSNPVSQTITVVDTVPPTITCPNAIVLGCNASIPAPNINLVTASDNCSGSVTIIWLGDGTPTTNSACIETRVRTYRATDACGNANTCTQSISRTLDTIPPVLNCPADVQVECNASTAPANTGTATATDNCTVNVTHTDVTTSQNCYSYITRTWTATDLCGNTVSCNQHILIVDRTAPVFNCQANVQLACGAAIPTPGVSDNCSSAGQITVFFSDVMGSGGCPGSTNKTRTWTAIDASGNKSTCVQQISFASARTAGSSPVVTDKEVNAGLQVSAYPNPFESKVTIEFTPSISGDVKIEIFNTNGDKISELYKGYSEKGKVYKFDFDGRDQSQGVYFYRITSNGTAFMNKLILIKQ